MLGLISIKDRTTERTFMCVYSMVADHYIDKWKELVPKKPDPIQYIPPAPYTYPMTPSPSPLTPEEIEDFRKMIKRAKEYDERTGQKSCELEEKKEILRKLAKELGVELEL